MINVNNRIVDEISTISVMNDKEVVRLEFKIKNQVTDLLKLTDCVVYINYMNGSLKDRYLVTDLSGDDEVTFSWTLGRNATAKQGKTFFVICAQKMNGTEIVQEWNSVLTSFDVKKGLETLTAPVEPYTDIFSQLTEMIEGKQDALIAGDNITIIDNVISAAGGGDAGNCKGLYYYETAADMQSAYYQYIADTSLVNDKFVLLISMAEWNNGTDDLRAGIYQVSYNSYEEIIMTTEELNTVLTAFSERVTELVQNEALLRQTADNDLQGQIDAITVSSDVVDVVGTYTDLQNYDTQHIKANDIIKVLQDSTHNDALSYYRWVIIQNVGSWVYVGSEGPFYTKAEANELYQAKVDIAQGSANADKQLTTDANGNVITEARPTIGGVTVKGAKSLADFGIYKYVPVFMSALPNVGVVGVKYYIPDTYPSAIIPYVNLAYARWGDLSKYPYFIVLEGNSYIRYIFANRQPFIGGNGNVQTTVGDDGIVVVRYTKSNGTIDYEELGYLNHGFSSINYSNFDVMEGGSVYQSANLDQDIDYSNGLSTTATCKVYVWNGSTFDLIGKAQLTGLVDDTIKPTVENYIVQSTGQNTDKVMSQKAVTDELATGLATKEDKALVFENITVATTDWVSGNTYPDYPYKAVLNLTGVTASMSANVYLAPASAALGIVPSFGELGSGTLTIYSTSNESAITIDRVVVMV